MSEISSTGTPAAPPYTRKNPFLAELILHQHLTKPGSEKDTRHFVLSLAGSGIHYTPGDSLAVFARNPPQLVDEVIGLLGFDSETPVKDAKGQSSSLRQVLRHGYVLNRASKKILSALAECIPQGEQRNRLMEIVDNGEVLNEYVHTRDYVDILKEFDEARFDTPEAFLSQLSPIPPRLYSVASSLAAHPDEAHLCISIVRYETHGRKRTGLCSGFMADQAELHRKNIPVYVQESRHFRLPKEATRDLIMVGPGTGIAPFRAFLEQRALEGATGRHWFFFGEQHRKTDFLYEADFRAFQKNGILHRFDQAFSRDQPEKIYVQHRLKEHAAEVWAWLQNGAYFYVCGDARRMAKDVHQALIDLAQKPGGLSPEAAAEYVNVTLMMTERRYLRDVY